MSATRDLSVRRLDRVTTSVARQLDRAMVLLAKGRISHGRWVETLAAWCRGEDVSAWDYGNAEPTKDRIVIRFRGQEVRTGEVAAAFDIPIDHAATYLRRLAAERRIQKIAFGRWFIGAPPRVGTATSTKGQ